MNDYDYKVHESVLIKILGYAFIVIAIGIAALGLFISVEDGRNVCFGAGACIAAVGGLFLLDYYRRGLYIIHSGKEYIYKPFIGPSKHFFRSDIARYEIRAVKFSPQDQCIVLYDYEGKKIAGLEFNMTNSEKFADEIATAEDIKKYENGETKSTIGEYFVEDKAVEDSAKLTEDKESRAKKIKIININNYILGAVMLGAAFIGIKTDLRIYSLFYVIGYLFMWIYAIVLRNYMVIEYNKNESYEKDYASFEFPIFSASVASLMGMSLFRNITYVDDIWNLALVLVFSLLLLFMFIALPKRKPYKIYFYVIIFVMAFISGLFFSNSVSYVTAEVERVEDIEVLDTDISYGSKGRKSYYITVECDSLHNEEVNVPKYIYDYAEGPLKDELVVVFATDVLGQEFYTIELDY